MDEATQSLFPRLTRRQFLRRLGMASGAVIAGPMLREFDAFAATGKPLHVIIVGAGLAGLCAAYELEKRGHRCTMLEADSRHLGGRVRTLRFDDGLYAEAGAMRIPLRHTLTRHYVQEFGLTLRPFVQSNPEAYYYLRGQRARIREIERLKPLYALTAAERAKSPDDLWAESITRRVKAMSDAERRDLMAEQPATPAIRALDQQSLQQLFEADGLSPEAIELLAATSGSETLLPSAATEHLREELEQVWTQEFHEIVGGSDRLPAAFVQRLKSKPRIGCEVIRLEQDKVRQRASAVYRRAGRTERVDGDYLVCTLPFSVLARLEVDPSFSGPKQRAIRTLNYDSATKVLAVSRRRFWETDDGIYGGGSYTDLPIGMAYYPSDNAAHKDPRIANGPGAMLASYTWGQMARQLAALPHAQRAELVIGHLSRVHPQWRQKGMLRHTASWSWDNHPWSAGAFAWFMPGQHTALHRHIVAPEGRIYFAGEHTSLTHTWMQGALESARRVVQEMLAAAAIRS